MIRSAAVYFGIVFGVGFLLGVVRVPLLVPRFGERAAELAEMPWLRRGLAGARLAPKT